MSFAFRRGRRGNGGIHIQLALFGVPAKIALDPCHDKRGKTIYLRFGERLPFGNMMPAHDATSAACGRRMLGGEHRMPFPRCLLAVFLRVCRANAVAQHFVGMTVDRRLAFCASICAVCVAELELRAERRTRQPLQRPCDPLFFIAWLRCRRFHRHVVSHNFQHIRITRVVNSLEHAFPHPHFAGGDIKLGNWQVCETKNGYFSTKIILNTRRCGSFVSPPAKWVGERVAKTKSATQFSGWRLTLWRRGGLNPGPVTVPSFFYMLSLLTRRAYFRLPSMPQTTDGEPSRSTMSSRSPAVQLHE